MFVLGWLGAFLLIGMESASLILAGRLGAGIVSAAALVVMLGLAIQLRVRLDKGALTERDFHAITRGVPFLIIILLCYGGWLFALADGVHFWPARTNYIHHGS